MDILCHISHKYAKQGHPYLISTGALDHASIKQWLPQFFNAPSADMVFSLGFLPPSLPRQNDNGKEVVVVNASANAKQGQKEEEMLKLFEQRKEELETLLDM